MERLDEADLLGETDEAAWQNHPVLRVKPADERLSADHAARTQIDFGLVVQRELATLNGLPEVRHQRQTLRAVTIECRRVNRESAVGLLGQKHRDIGLAQHVVRGRPLAVGKRDPDTGSHIELEPFDHERAFGLR